MLQIPCPSCGPRDETEFSYRGDATLTRPAADAGIDAYIDFVYTRRNPRGWQVEWWQHSAGCRAFIKVRRHTVTHEIAGVAAADQPLEVEPA